MDLEAAEYWTWPHGGLILWYCEAQIAGHRGMFAASKITPPRTATLSCAAGKTR